MKHYILLFSILTFCLCHSCITWGTDDDESLSSEYQPIIMQRADFESTTLLESTPRTIENSGKIYVKDNFIFINEVNKGFHIINNSNPENPINIAFVKVLGSSDLSIKNNIFYVNNARDLIAFTINETTNALTITKRIKNVFPQIWSPDGFQYYGLGVNDIIVDWELVN
ncbi:MAG: hypothetical protein HRT67_00875 [Flavobacteriaceae bacterium]|nr:hypothetical protein [Flavobacteriaceae bacterium]